MTLSPYAIADTNDSRRYPEPEASGPGCFRIDRERIGRCSAFRRLDYKTQVFLPHEHDHYRTRLTHTLEVAQVGRSLGRSLGLNEDLIEAVALAHDLGHPPFGHAGQAELDERMAGHGRFEHNRQSLRIVDLLEHPFPTFRGLNLTHATRECLARHETRYDTPMETEFPPNRRGPLEGQVVDLADEIAFAAADLEDALSAGWAPPEALGELELWQRAWRRAKQRFPQARAIHTRIQAIRAVLEIVCEDALAGTRKRLRDAGIDSPDAVRGAPEKLVALSDETAEAFRALQRFLFEHVYRHPKIVEQEQSARRIVRELFEAFVRRENLLPARYARRIERGEDSAHRVVCDYVAGMTDRFCHQEHARCCNA